MAEQYSEWSACSPRPGPERVLALDTGSPRVSVAATPGAGIVAERVVDLGQSSARLLDLVHEVLAEASLAPADLEALVALRGPGSFTGLRVGLATALGLHQALGVPATAIGSLEVLASLAPPDGSLVVAAVDALRGEWFLQPFRAVSPPVALADPSCAGHEALFALAPSRVIGFALEGLELETPHGKIIEILEPDSLAAATLRLLSRRAFDWDTATLAAPLYLRDAPVHRKGSPS